MPKLEKIKMEKSPDGKITYVYMKTEENGKSQIIKTVYEPTSSERLPFAMDLIQRMKKEDTKYKNNADYWKEYQERSLKERPDLQPYHYGHFLKLNRFKSG